MSPPKFLFVVCMCAYAIIYNAIVSFTSESDS